MRTQATYDDLLASLRRIGQEQVLTLWKSLNAGEQGELAADIAALNLAELPSLARLAVEPGASHAAQALLPANVQSRSSLNPAAVEQGRTLLAAGKVAAFTVAGGQGTRLGYDGPKGAFCISPVRNKPLFQLFAESILATNRRYGCRAPWYIMTSPVNDAATRQFFHDHTNFGLPFGDIIFFQQGVMPAFDRAGRILLDQKHRLALSPDGHGGSLLALRTSGMLDHMAHRGIKHISYFQVDNPLVACLDPAFVGFHDLAGSEMSSKTLPKADDLERVGNFAMRDGKMLVIEYSDLPESQARSRNADGTRTFDAANIAVHLLSREFVERLTSDPESFALPWHRAEKKVPFVDLTTGTRVEPAAPNGVKLEAFVFDALPLAKNPLLLETSRGEEFSPVKNATGVDSVATARRDMSRRAARWLEYAGWKIPRQSDGEPDGVFEISPLAALDAEELATRYRSPKAVRPGETVFLDGE